MTCALLLLAQTSGVAAASSAELSTSQAQQTGAVVAAGTRWIDVNLRTQSLVAYQGIRPVYSTRISSGVAKYPTVTGTFYVYAKLPTTRMTGGVGRDHYDLPNVPNVMYFYRGYGIHGTYWHNNFGHPMSHGCVNVSLSAAAWLFRWAPGGTRVTVHY